MRNRERYITHRNEFDLMMEIAENLLEKQTFCAIYAISGKRPKCMKKTLDGGTFYDCYHCIGKWLNEEAQG